MQGIVEPLRVPVRRLDPELPLPGYAHPGDAGLDLRVRSAVRLEPGERALVGTGVALAIPEGYCGLVTPRSGLASASGLSLANTPGVVDAGYRGEVKLALVNLDPREVIDLERGERVAQLLLVPVARATLEEVATLPDSARGEGGHGSTGRS